MELLLQIKFTEIHSIIITPQRESSSFIRYIHDYSSGLATSPKFNNIIPSLIKLTLTQGYWSAHWLSDKFISLHTCERHKFLLSFGYGFCRTLHYLQWPRIVQLLAPVWHSTSGNRCLLDTWAYADDFHLNETCCVFFHSQMNRRLQVSSQTATAEKLK